MRQVWYPFTSWECIAAGMYESMPPEGLSAEECRARYKDFLSDLRGFRCAMERVAREWPISCEHFLTNPNINRIAWLGQSAMCITTGVPAIFRGGFMLLNDRAKYLANLEAQRFLYEWIERYESENQRIRGDLEGARLSEGYSGRRAGRPIAGEFSPIVQGHLFGDSA